jgi:hypothetical protein
MDLDTTLAQMEAGSSTSDPMDEISTLSHPTTISEQQEYIGLELSDKQAGKRPRRERRLPARYQDVLPEPPPVVVNNGAASGPIPTRSFPHIRLIVRDTIQTVANVFGLWREYPHRPSYDPDHFIPHDSLSLPSPPNQGTIIQPDEEDTEQQTRSAPSNSSLDLLLHWQNSGSTTKSHAEMDRLVEILHHPDFSIDCLPKHLNAAWENRKRDQQEEKSPHQSLKGFQETTVKVEVPSGDKNIRSRFVDVPGLHFRKLTTIIQDAFKSPLASRFHYSLFKLFHKCPNSGEEQRVFSELYNSDAFLKEHDSVQRAPVPPDDPGCKREKVVAALMFWSDSTHLTNFGMAKLWPIYMFLGNLSKYIRAETSSQACYHVAYIPSLPDSFQDILGSFHARWNTQKKGLLTHCRRELMHTVWRILLDDDFLHAYKYGIVIKCQDGMERRVYPRIFTYSADYPEK